MNFKIITANKTRPEVLLFRGIDDNSDPMVRILCIGLKNNGNDFFEEEDVVFRNIESAKRFVSDYSVESADLFCKRNGIELPEEDS